MHTAIPDWVSLITWLFSELQTCLNSSWALCSPDLRHGGMCTCLPRVPTRSVVYTRHRRLAPRLLAQAGRDAGGPKLEFLCFLGCPEKYKCQ